MISVNMVDAFVYEVVVEGAVESTHRVQMSHDLYCDLCGMTVTHEFVLIQSFRFLLDQVANTDVPASFNLEDISREYPDFLETVKSRLMR